MEDFNYLLQCIGIRILENRILKNNKPFFRILANSTQLEILQIAAAERMLNLNLIPIINQQNKFEIFPK